jgi:hypothetical protein
LVELAAAKPTDIKGYDKLKVEEMKVVAVMWKDLTWMAFVGSKGKWERNPLWRSINRIQTLQRFGEEITKITSQWISSGAFHMYPRIFHPTSMGKQGITFTRTWILHVYWALAVVAGNVTGA